MGVPLDFRGQPSLDHDLDIFQLELRESVVCDDAMADECPDSISLLSNDMINHCMQEFK